LSVCFEIGSHYITQAGFILPSAGLTGIYYHAQLLLEVLISLYHVPHMHSASREKKEVAEVSKMSFL
jgi:hypothetical protein